MYCMLIEYDVNEGKLGKFLINLSKLFSVDLLLSLVTHMMQNDDSNQAIDTDTYDNGGGQLFC